MPERPTVSLLFGQGIDRATGILAQRPSSWSDLRNLILYDGKAQIRGGMTVQSLIGGAGGWGLDWGNDWGGAEAVDDILAAGPFRSRQLGVVVGWKEADRTVRIFKTSSIGTQPELIGSWFVAEADVGRPRVVMAEIGRKMFFAHEFVPFISGFTTLRGPTFYWDPDDSVTPLKALTADLDRDSGAETIRFRGVLRYLQYLVGWGYGTGSDEDRGEIVRVSVPGDPLTLEPEHYFIAGAVGDPVVTCTKAGNVLAVFKETESDKIVGYDRRTFGIVPLDPHYGCVGARLALTVGGIGYFWSHEGPRATIGEGSTDLAVPLDLNAPEPADLVARGPAAEAFAVHLPSARTNLWCWPDPAEEKTRVYAQQIRRPDDIKWAYWELGWQVTCGGVFVPAVAPSLPTGFPDFDGATGVLSNQATINWINVDAIGDEIVELWFRESPSGEWIKQTEVPVSGETQQFSFPVDPNLKDDVLVGSTTYDVALRYRRGSVYNTGASNSDPATWPAVSRGSFTTTAQPAGPATHSVGLVSGQCFSGCELCTYPFSWSAHMDDPPWQHWRSHTGFANAVINKTGPNGTSTTDLIETQVGVRPFGCDPEAKVYSYWVRWIFANGEKSAFTVADDTVSNQDACADCSEGGGGGGGPH